VKASATWILFWSVVASVPVAPLAIRRSAVPIAIGG